MGVDKGRGDCEVNPMRFDPEKIGNPSEIEIFRFLCGFWHLSKKKESLRKFYLRHKVPIKSTKKNNLIVVALLGRVTKNVKKKFPKNGTDGLFVDLAKRELLKEVSNFDKR